MSPADACDPLPPSRTSSPLDVLAELEARRRHPAQGTGRLPDPVDTAQAFHDELEAPAGRVLPRDLADRGAPSACRIGIDGDVSSPGARAVMVVLTLAAGVLLGAAVYVLLAGW